jgi:hypothetical protein
MLFLVKRYYDKVSLNKVLNIFSIVCLDQISTDFEIKPFATRIVIIVAPSCISNSPIGHPGVGRPQGVSL